MCVGAPQRHFSAVLAVGGSPAVYALNLKGTRQRPQQQACVLHFCSSRCQYIKTSGFLLYFLFFLVAGVGGCLVFQLAHSSAEAELETPTVQEGSVSGFRPPGSKTHRRGCCSAGSFKCVMSSSRAFSSPKGIFFLTFKVERTHGDHCEPKTATKCPN